MNMYTHKVLGKYTMGHRTTGVREIVSLETFLFDESTKKSYFWLNISHI